MNSAISDGDKYKQMQKTALILYEKFIETLTEEQKAMFEEVLDKMFELNDELTKNDAAKK